MKKALGLIRSAALQVVRLGPSPKDLAKGQGKGFPLLAEPKFFSKKKFWCSKYTPKSKFRLKKQNQKKILNVV